MGALSRRIAALPIRHKLAALAIISSTLTLLLLLAATLILTREAAKESLGFQLEMTRPLITAALAAPLIERNYAALRETALEIVKSGPVRSLSVYTSDGIALVSEHGHRPAGHIEQRASIPLVESGLKLGSVEIVLTADPFAHLMDQLALAILLAMTGAAMLAFVFYQRLARLLSVRIEKLAAAAEALAAGDLNQRAPIEGEVEIRRLAQSFNHMAARLSEQIAALTAAETRQRELAEHEGRARARLEALFSSLGEGIAFTDASGRILLANAALRRIGEEELEPEGLTIEEWRRQAGLTPSTETDDNEPFASGGREMKSRDGREFIETSLAVAAAEAPGRLWLYEDVTERRRALRALDWLAEHDPLTGLANGRALERELAQRCAELGRRPDRLALVYLDLDDFKNINDSFGQAAGDAVLIRIGRHLAEALRRDALMARLRGDVFAIVAWVSNAEAAHEMIGRLRHRLAEMSLECEGQPLHPTASIGYALAPDHGSDAEALTVAADAALYRAKLDGRNRVRAFDPSLRAHGALRLSWKERLIEALERDLFELHYQGVWHADGRLSHAEALLRLHDGSREGPLIPPAAFIPHAEESGLIRQIDRLVFTKAIEAMKQHPRLEIAVNVSGRSVEDGDFAGFAAEALAAAQIPPERLIVEITETAAVGDLANARSFLSALRNLGCRIALDDFGAGYSSFSYLKHLRADLVKIDGQFVRNLHQDEENQIFVRAIAEAAALVSTGGAIAEFVEHEETARLLPRLGVRLMQGYWFDRPAPLAAFLERAFSH
ncbi:MAG: EAL domain-containing protein [Rhodocyclaceae bacterium]|nr:EAL domain-containing protein [Rhodocyclaceae bacterium]